MKDDSLTTSVTKFWGGHRLALLISMSTILALGLVSLSLYLYISSGAIQLDLSRPGYQGVSSQTDGSYKVIENYPETGKLDESSIGEFETLFNAQSNKAKLIDSFGGDPLSPASLGLISSES